MTRLYIYAAIALAFVGLIARDHFQTKKLNKARVEVTTLKASLLAQAENTRKANEASEQFHRSLEALKAARAATPTRIVRLCVGPVVSESGTAPGADAAGTEGLPQAAGPDIGARLYDLADEADLCPVQLESLQEWIRNR